MDISKIDPERYAKLEKDVRMLKDVHQINNLFGTYAVMHVAAEYERSLELFAMELPDVSVEIADLGKQVGAENVRKVLVDYQMAFRGSGKGYHSEHNLATPVIVVAGDGKTAKGIWQSPGLMNYVENGENKPFWTWFKYGVDFIKIDNVWKIWHMHAYEIFTADYETGWAQPVCDWFREKSEAAKKAAGLDENAPVTHHNPYSKDYLCEYYPVVPADYETYEGSEVI